MKKVICSQKAPGAIGPYSQAIEANGMVFVSGQLPIDAATGAMAESAEAQARQSLENVKHILEEAGLSMANIAKTWYARPASGWWGTKPMPSPWEAGADTWS